MGELIGALCWIIKALTVFAAMILIVAAFMLLVYIGGYAVSWCFSSTLEALLLAIG